MWLLRAGTPPLVQGFAQHHTLATRQVLLQKWENGGAEAESMNSPNHFQGRENHARPVTPSV